MAELSAPEPSRPDTEHSVQPVLVSNSIRPVSKVADRPHNVSIVLSVLALVVSILSFGVSWRALSLNKLSLRAEVEITEIKFQLPHLSLDKFRDVRDIQKYLRDSTNGTIFEGRITNFGKTRAKQIVVRAQAKGWSSAAGRPTNMSMPPVVMELPDIAPGRTQYAYIPVGFFSDPAPEHIMIYGTLRYVDEASGNVSTEEWCYESAGKTQPVALFGICADRIHFVPSGKPK